MSITEFLKSSLCCLYLKEHNWDIYKLGLGLMKESNKGVVTSHLASLWQKWDLNLLLLTHRAVRSIRGHSVLMVSAMAFPLTHFEMCSGSRYPVKSLFDACPIY